MKRIGLIGISPITNQLIESIQQLHQFQWVGIYVPEQHLESVKAQKFGLPTFNHPLDLIAESDMLHFSSSALQTHDFASLAIRSSRHLFLDSQYLTQPIQAQKLSELAREAQIKVGISRVDRYNEAIMKARDFVDQPTFIECRRAVLPFDGTESLYQLLLRDVDLVISFVNSGVKRIQSRSSNPHDNTANMVNVRIEFDNGCVANLNLSTLSSIAYSKMAIYQHDSVIHIDLQNRQLEVLSNQPHSSKIASINFLENGLEQNVVKLQYQNFSQCIDENRIPSAGLDDTLQALQIIEEVQRQMK